MSEAEGGKLSKEEVEALLEATREEEPPPVERPEPVRRVHGYDFTQPSRFNKSELDQLRKINDELPQAATDRCSRLLRTSIKAQLVSMDQMKWENFLEETGESVVAFVFALEPIGHRGVLTIDRGLASAALDRMMGGPGEMPEGAVEFSELDVRTFSRLAWVFLEPLQRLWHDLGEFHVVLGKFLHDLPSSDLYPPDEDLFQLCFLLQGNIGSGQVALSVPFQAVRSLPPQERESEQNVAETAEAVSESLRENLRDTQVELTVLLGSADIKVGSLVRVEAGDVITLDRRIGDALAVRVNDKVKLRGYPGVADGKYAIKLITQE